MKTDYKAIQNELGHYSVKPMPTDEDLKEHYAQYYSNPHTTTYQVEYTDKEIQHKKLRARLNLHAIDLVFKDQKSDRKLLEIGYGEGFLLQEAHENGYQVSGIDFTMQGIHKFHPNLATCLEEGDAYGYLDRLMADDIKYDVCVLQNVLEHVIDPVDILGRLRSLLSKDGLLVINVPNDYSPLQKLLKDLGHIDQDFWFAPPEHLHYFNVKNLEAFVNDQGYDVLDKFGDFPIDLYLMHPGSNYIADKSQGKAAHHARIDLDILMAESGMKAYHNFCQSLSGVGIGRNVAIILRKKSIG